MRKLPSARDLDTSALLDHLPQLIDQIASSLDGAELPQANAAETHALSRLDEGFDLGQVVAEYAVLRECIETLWTPPGDASEQRSALVVANRAIDASISEAVERYTRARERTLQALDRISTAALESDNLDELLRRLMHVFIETTASVDTAAILLREQGDILRLRAAVGLEEELGRDFVLNVGEGFSGRVAASRAPLLVRSAATDPLVKSDVARKRGIRALYGVPLLHGGDVIGVANMGSLTAFDFSDQDKRLFAALASRATVAIRQHMIEQQRDETLSRLDALLRAAPVAIGFLDTNLRYIRVNDALARMNGRSAETHVGRTVREVLPEAAAVLEPMLRGVLETRQSLLNVELNAASPAAPGVLRSFQGSFYPVFDSDGRVIGIGGIAVDITDRKQAQEALERAAEFRERFIGILGHDLRNPLASIRLTADGLLQREDLPERFTRPLVRVVQSADRMDRLIRDIADFTRGRFGGTLPLRRENVRLEDVCRAVADELEAVNPGHELQVDALGGCEGWWDRDRLTQLVSNLAANAIQHGGPDGPVVLRSCGEGDRAVLEVHNRGEPIPAELLPRVFEPFQQADPTPSESGQSLGLGLYIVRQIVVAHGGEIDVTSSVEAGTTFRVVLPRHRPP